MLGWLGKILSKLTGASVNVSVRTTPDKRRGGIRTRRYTKTETFAEPVVAKEVSYGSLDEVPPELRDQFETLMEAARDDPSGTHVYETTSHQISVTDQDGATQTYDSLDALPPEIRARVEEQLRRKGP